MYNVLSPQEVLNFFAVYSNGKKVWDFSQWLYNIHTQMTIILEFTSTYNETSALWMYPKTDEKSRQMKSIISKDGMNAKFTFTSGCYAFIC